MRDLTNEDLSHVYGAGGREDWGGHDGKDGHKRGKDKHSRKHKTSRDRKHSKRNDCKH